MGTVLIEEVIMGFDMMASVHRLNKETNKYEKLDFYDKNGKKLNDLFPTRDGMLNQLLVGHNRQGYDFESIDACRGLPDWFVDTIKEEHPDWFDNHDSWAYDTTNGTYYDYLELRGWAQGDTCNFTDWHSEEYADEDDDMKIPRKRNALKSFIRTVDLFLAAYGIYAPMPGEIIIVCEMSY
jgi:hypothetical protein